MNYDSLVTAGVAAVILNFLAFVCFIYNIVREKQLKEVSALTYRFNRIFAVWSFQFVLLSIDPSTNLGLCDSCVVTLWNFTAVMVAVVLSTLLVLWMDSMVRIFDGNNYSENVLARLTKWQIAYVATLTVLIFTRSFLKKQVRTELIVSLVVVYYITASLIFVTIAVSRMVYIVIRKLTETSKALSAKNVQNSSSKNEVKRILRKMVGFLFADLVALLILIIIIRHMSGLLQRLDQEEKKDQENAYKNYPWFHICICFTKAILDFAFYTFALRIRSTTSVELKDKRWKGTTSPNESGPIPSLKTLSQRNSAPAQAETIPLEVVVVSSTQTEAS